MVLTNVTTFGVAVGATVLEVEVEVEDGNKKYFRDRNMNLRKNITKYAYLIVFIRGSVQLRYGGFSMESLLALVL